MHLGGAGVKPPIHFYCVLHAKEKGGGQEIQKACKNWYVINGRPQGVFQIRYDIDLIYQLENEAVKKNSGTHNAKSIFYHVFNFIFSITVITAFSRSRCNCRRLFTSITSNINFLQSILYYTETLFSHGLNT